LSREQSVLLGPVERQIEFGQARRCQLDRLTALQVSESGRVTAIELDGGLAERLAANFAGRPNVRALQGDGAQIEFDPAGLIYVNAGATRPAHIWLDRLNDCGDHAATPKRPSRQAPPQAATGSQARVRV
jgi:protein-L-isoaspartate O-methyltransferase